MRDDARSDRYVLRGGHAGAARLRLLSRVKWPTTERLLDLAGLRAGMRVLDVGCGGGDVTRAISSLVGDGGEVVGVDRDAEILDLARRETEALGLTSVRFCQGSAEGLDEETAYDFVYARYLLSHLAHPERALGAMVRALRPGGRLAVEDVFFSGHVCYPGSRAFDRFVELYGAVARRSGGDPEIGRRLLLMSLEAGLDEAEVGLVVPTFRHGEGKRVAAVTMEHIREAVTSSDLATDEEVDALVDELDAFASDDRTFLSIAPTFQVWGRKGRA